MIEPTHIKPNEIKFFSEEYIKFKGIDIPFDFNKSHIKVIGILQEIHGAYYASFGVIGVLGIGYTSIQKYTNVHNDNNNIKNLSLLDIKKGKFEMNSVKKISVGHGLFIGRNERNETVDVLSILGIFLVSIYATLVEINRPIKNDIDK